MRFYINDYSCRDHYTSTYLTDQIERGKQAIQTQKQNALSDTYRVVNHININKLFLDSEAGSVRTERTYYETGPSKKLVVRNDVDPLFYTQYENRKKFETHRCSRV